MASKKRLKATAQVQVPQNKDECAAFVGRLGDLQRELQRLQLAMNGEIAVITKRYQPQLEAQQALIDPVFKGIQAWCEANRSAITDGLKVKSANLVTGDVTWRIATPSCSVTGQDAVITTLKQLKLLDYVRSVESVNKEAVIATVLVARTISPEEATKDPAKAKLWADARTLSTVSGLKVVTGVEAFSVVPFEQETA